MAVKVIVVPDATDTASFSTIGIIGQPGEAISGPAERQPAAV